MRPLTDLIDFLDRLEDKKMCYRLSKSRDSIMVEVPVPVQRWEIEFMADGTIEIEKFLTEVSLYGEEEIEVLFRDFAN